MYLVCGMIYKLLRLPEWERFRAEGRLAGSRQDLEDGFIHFSTAGQAAETAARHFAGVADLVLAEVDVARAGREVKWERSRGGQLFPHLYGVLPLAAVARSWPLPLGPDGRHVLPAELLRPRSLYPRPIEDEVYHCGFSSPKSYGAASYLVQAPGGNWLTDSPRLTDVLVESFAERGGLAYIFLTHRDDVADAADYARIFGAQRVIHEADADAAPGAELVLRGERPVELAPGFLAIPTPGHTRGHMVLLYRGKFLFSGDHLEGDPASGRLEAFEDFCWHDWREQARSVEKLAAYRFEWVLPGHGRRLKLSPEAMAEALLGLARRMRAEGPPR